MLALVQKAYRRAKGVDFETPLPHGGPAAFDFPLFRRTCTFAARLPNEGVAQYFERHYLNTFLAGYYVNVARMVHEGQPDLVAEAAIEGAAPVPVTAGLFGVQHHYSPRLGRQSELARSDECCFHHGEIGDGGRNADPSRGEGLTWVKPWAIKITCSPGLVSNNLIRVIFLNPQSSLERR